MKQKEELRHRCALCHGSQALDVSSFYYCFISCNIIVRQSPHHLRGGDTQNQFHNFLITCTQKRLRLFSHKAITNGTIPEMCSWKMWRFNSVTKFSAESVSFFFSFIGQLVHFIYHMLGSADNLSYNHTHTRTLALYLMTGTHVWVSAWRHMHAHKHVHLSADRISISFLGVKWSFCAGTVGEKKKKQQVFGVQTHDREYLTSPDWADHLAVINTDAVVC